MYDLGENCVCCICKVEMLCEGRLLCLSAQSCRWWEMSHVGVCTAQRAVNNTDHCFPSLPNPTTPKQLGNTYQHTTNSPHRSTLSDTTCTLKGTPSHFSLPSTMPHGTDQPRCSCRLKWNRLLAEWTHYNAQKPPSQLGG